MLLHPARLVLVDRVIRAVQVALPKVVHTMQRVVAEVALARQVLEFLVVVRCLMLAPAVLVFSGLLTLLITPVVAVVVVLALLQAVAVAVLEAAVLVVLEVIQQETPEIVVKPILVVVAVVAVWELLEQEVLVQTAVKA